MVVSQNGTKTTLALSDLSKMFFSTTSGIQQTENEPATKRSEDIYDLSGRKIINQSSSLKTLPKGIYIVGGRKVVVK